MCSVTALIRAEDLRVMGADVMPTALLTTVGLFLGPICPHSHLVRGPCGQVTTVPLPEANIHGVYFEYVF